MKRILIITASVLCLAALSWFAMASRPTANPSSAEALGTEGAQETRVVPETAAEARGAEGALAEGAQETRVVPETEALGAEVPAAQSQPTVKPPVVTGVRNADGTGKVRLEAVLVNPGEPYIGKVNTRIINRVREPGRIINRVIAETINYERITEGASVIQTFAVNNIPAEGGEYYARTVVYGPDNGEVVTETPFSFSPAEAPAQSAPAE